MIGPVAKGEADMLAVTVEMARGDPSGKETFGQMRITDESAMLMSTIIRWRSHQG